MGLEGRSARQATPPIHLPPPSGADGRGTAARARPGRTESGVRGVLRRTQSSRRRTPRPAPPEPPAGAPHPTITHPPTPPTTPRHPAPFATLPARPPTTTPATRLTFTDLHRRFGRLRVLRGVSGEVGPGEALLVTGANGSGKSTLLRVLAGLLAAGAGTVDYRQGGRSLDIAERRRAVGYVAPDLALYEELTTLENLQLLLPPARRLRPARGGELLDLVGLPHDRPAGALSSGMRQRLRWTWALLARPRLLLLDEPFQNLDRPGVDQGTELLERHLAGGGLAVVANPGPLEIPDVRARLDLSARRSRRARHGPGELRALGGRGGGGLRQGLAVRVPQPLRPEHPRPLRLHHPGGGQPGARRRSATAPRSPSPCCR